MPRAFLSCAASAAISLLLIACSSPRHDMSLMRVPPLENAPNQTTTGDVAHGDTATIPPETFEPETVTPPLTIPESTAPLISPAPTIKAQPLYGWIDSEAWAAELGLTPVISRTPVGGSSFALTTPKGLLVWTSGQRIATWNGINIALNFAPVMRNGRTALHSLDIAKTLEPLLAPSLPVLKAGDTILLDPGHGGPNEGATGGNSLFEKDMALDWAIRIRALLVGSGFNVHLTRTNDVDLPLAERVAIASRVGAALFISLHFNSAPSGPKQSGIETYCMTPSGAPSTITREYEDDTGRAFPNNAFDEQNIVVAEKLHRAMLAAGKATDRGVRRARFMGVLREQNRPAALLEGGYLTNPAEARLIATSAYRQQLAEAVARAISEMAQPDKQTLPQ